MSSTRLLTVLLVAEEAAGIKTLRLLADSGHRIAGVMTAPPTRGGGATVGGVAEGLGLPVLPSAEVRNPSLAGWIREREVELLLNVHSLYLIHPDIVAAPRIGSFNLHPGPLPDYAGLNAPSWAIYHGERRHAVTLHWMEPRIDTGPIAYEAHFDIGEEDTALAVSVRCVNEGLPLVARLLDGAARDPASIPAVAQDLSRRRYFGRDVPGDGRITWEWPAREIVDLVRACDYFPFPSPWGQPVARLGGKEIEILKASRTGERATEAPGTISAGPDDAVRIAAGDEWVVVHRVQLNGRPVRASEVLLPGVRLSDGDRASAAPLDERAIATYLRPGAWRSDSIAKPSEW